MNRGRLSGDRTSANGRRSLFFPSFVSSFAFLSRVRDLETADRVRCNYPPSGRRGRSVPWSVRSFVRPGLCREVNASRVCSPIGRQRAGGEHSVHSSSDSHTAFPIPRADDHRQSETSHEILHGENLRVPAAFPLIRTRGNRPFRSRGERGPRATRCNNIVVVCIDSFTLFSPFLFHHRRVLPFLPSSFVSCDFRASSTLHAFCVALIPLRYHFLFSLSLSLSLSPSLSLFLSRIRVRGHDHTLCTARHRHPQGGHSFVWYSTRWPLATFVWICALPSSQPLRIYTCPSYRGPQLRENSPLASIRPAGIYVRAVHRGKRFYKPAENLGPREYIHLLGRRGGLVA